MRLPNIQYQSKPSRASQINFRGIDRNLVTSDGGIYDMINISTHDFPVLTAVADRYVADNTYDMVWHYGKAHKEYVVAGKITPNGNRYPKWETGGSYNLGAQCADNGRIYVCIKSEDAGARAPRVNSDCWDIDSSVMFEYNGDWKKDGTYNKGDILYYSGNYYRNISGENSETYPSEDVTNWESYSYAKFYYDDKEIEGLELIPGEKETAYLNGNIIILPDGVYYNVDTNGFGYLTGTKSGSFNTKNYSGYYTKGKWYNRPLKARLLEKYRNPSGADITMGAIQMRWDSEVKESGAEHNELGLFDLTTIFNPGDAIQITQAYKGKDPGYTIIEDGTYEVSEVTVDTLVFSSNAFAGAKIGKDSLSDIYYYLGEALFSKGIPEMDYLCTSNNRVWGCKDDTVYASELGNVFSWTRYGTEDIDPVFIESGDIGSFTGCCEYGGYPLFFKEKEMYRVYGDVSSNFSIVKIADYGLRADSPHSISVVNSVLLFLSDLGVCAYTGGIPAVISTELKRKLSDGVSGTDGTRYYLSVDDGEGRRIYVYDTYNRVWSSEEREDKPIAMVSLDNDLVAMSQNGVRETVSRPSGTWGTKTEVRHNAVIEFADFYEGYIGTKDVGKIIMRISMDPKKNPVFVYIQYDSDGQWHRIGKVFNQTNTKKVCEFGFFPRRCDHYRIKIECKGIFTLYSMARQTDLGNI